jgi:hypothetical protein
LREHEVAVGEPQRVLEEWRRGARFHRCFTSSGIGKKVGCR